MTEGEFKDLYLAMADQIHRYVRHRVPADATQDVTSETFETAWAHRHDFPSSRDSWPAWLVGIARNKVHQELQRRRRKHHDTRFVTDWVDADDEPASEDIATTVAQSLVARQVFEAFTPAEQDLFGIVCFFKDLTPAAGAAVLGITVTAYTTRLSRLRQRLESLTRALQTDPDPDSDSDSDTIEAN